jgi:hypothetical protein
MPKDPLRTQKAANAVPEVNLGWYDRLVATIPNVERKGATVSNTSLNGHMFSYLTPDGTLALRLPAEARTEFLERYHTRLVEAYGVVQKEYVVVPEALLQQTQKLQAYFQISFAYVNSQRPKPKKPGKPKSSHSNPRTASATKPSDIQNDLF